MTLPKISKILSGGLKKKHNLEFVACLTIKECKNVTNK